MIGALILIALITLFTVLLTKKRINAPDGAPWYLIVGGTFILAVPYVLGESNDYRLLFLLLPLAGILIWIGHNGPARILWPVAAALVISALTGASMITNDSGFILPKAALIMGDLALVITLAFGAAVWARAWVKPAKAPDSVGNHHESHIG